LVIDDINIITNRCEAIAKSERKDQKESEFFHNNNCPICKNKNNVNTHIVNKISDIDGRINTTIINTFGFKKQNTTTTITTNEVNHCNVCGNEWKKFKSKTVTKTQILKLALKYLAESIKNPEELENDWKLTAISVFNGCHAETIYKLSRHDKSDLFKSQLTLRKLRKQYKSIFN
jgi:hypothetical protein